MPERCRRPARGSRTEGRYTRSSWSTTQVTDRTIEVLEPLTDGSRVRILRNEVNRGKGFSVRRGMLEASGELRLMCDADCLPSLVSLADMVGSHRRGRRRHRLAQHRRLAGGQDAAAARRIASWNFLNLCRLVMNEPSRDIFCGFKLWRAGAARGGLRQPEPGRLGLRHRGARARAPARVPRASSWASSGTTVRVPACRCTACWFR